MRIAVLSFGALITAVLLVLAGGIFWEEFKSLRYVRRLDEWGSDVKPWQ